LASAVFSALRPFERRVRFGELVAMLRATVDLCDDSGLFLTPWFRP
jgi:hypothetical protein